MMTRWWPWVVAGMALVHGLSAATVDAQSVKQTGQLDLQLSVVEEQLAQLKELHGDPKLLTELRLKRLLGRPLGPDYRDLKRSIDLLKGQRVKHIENRKQLIEESEQQLKVYEVAMRYQEGKLSLDQVRASLLPVLEKDAQRYIDSGALTEDIGRLERRRSDLLKIREISGAGAARQGRRN